MSSSILDGVVSVLEKAKSTFITDIESLFLKIKTEAENRGKADIILRNIGTLMPFLEQPVPVFKDDEKPDDEVENWKADKTGQSLAERMDAIESSLLALQESYIEETKSGRKLANELQEVERKFSSEIRDVKTDVRAIREDVKTVQSELNNVHREVENVQKTSKEHVNAEVGSVQNYAESVQDFSESLRGRIEGMESSVKQFHTDLAKVRRGLKTVKNDAKPFHANVSSLLEDVSEAKDEVDRIDQEISAKVILIDSRVESLEKLREVLSQKIECGETVQSMIDDIYTRLDSKMDKSSTASAQGASAKNPQQGTASAQGASAKNPQQGAVQKTQQDMAKDERGILPTNSLSTGAVQDILKGGNPQKPKLQVIKVEPLLLHGYMFSVSDGECFFSRFHGRFRLSPLSIIELTEYVYQKELLGRVQIIDLKVLTPGEQVGNIIGNPIRYELLEEVRDCSNLEL